MGDGRASEILHYLRNLIGQRDGGGLTDGQLLARFVRDHDEAAFEVLVWRHGPMVLVVGQRVLHNPHDADDVLQATFLTLVRKAGSIGKGESLGSWLYKVAYRIALRAQTARSSPVWRSTWPLTTATRANCIADSIPTARRSTLTRMANFGSRVLCPA